MELRNTKVQHHQKEEIEEYASKVSVEMGNRFKPSEQLQVLNRLRVYMKYTMIEEISSMEKRKLEMKEKHDELDEELRNLKAMNERL